MSMPPLVSCIMPTYNRREFIPHAINYFQRQDYKNKELIIIDDGTDAVNDLIPADPEIRYIRLEKKITLGAKLNMACSEAGGDILINWDDDDWYAPWRIKYQVESLLQEKTGVCGINKLLYFDIRNKKGFQYIYPPDQRTWLLGSSLCYTRELWNVNRFAEIDVGMDGLFVWNTAASNVTVLENHSFSVHMIHNTNVSPKQTNGYWWHSFPVEEIQRVMGADWELYALNGHTPHAKPGGYERNRINGKQEPPSLKNIYACLVHENPECIKDLVLNLHHNDPESTILLYNGSSNPKLIPGDFPLNRFGAIVHPKPVPVRHGYLHKFALDCMEFSRDNFSFDSLTIVDSDQLSIKPGYPFYLKKHIDSATQPIGLLSSQPERVGRNNKTNHVALQAFREYDLWKPLLNFFPDGEEKFVHWSFWPSTVFMADAAGELVKIFKENELLQGIMERSKIWATEEVILPTLVRLLGFEISANPCSYDFVRYKIPVRIDEIDYAVKRTDAFWIHPVHRNLEDPVRKGLKERFDQYSNGKAKEALKDNPPIDSTKLFSILNKINKIEGWLSEKEAELLISATESACKNLVAPQTIVEVGSYHGKATVLMGMVIKEHFPEARIISIDPHDGKQGAADQGLKSFPPSFESFKKNMEEYGLQDIVEMIQANCQQVEWEQPVSFLLIDGLHDYMNVSRDFRQFAEWIRPGGYVAFHDYADYFPGVKVFVDELVKGGEYRKVEGVESLVVLEKI